jgi:transposase
LLVGKDRKRRIWSDDEKRMICAQTRVPGVSVSQVARRYDANTNLVFTWLRDPRFAQAVPDEDRAHFLPVEVIDGSGDEVPSAPVLNLIEIDLAGGHRMRISGCYDPEVLARLIRGLTA